MAVLKLLQPYYECYDGCAQAVQSARGHLCIGDGCCSLGSEMQQKAEKRAR